MAKKIDGYIKLQVPAGQANPSPPIGPALGQRGLNIMEFCKQFNAQDARMEQGTPIPVMITVFQDRSFTFEMQDAAGVATSSRRRRASNGRLQGARPHQRRHRDHGAGARDREAEDEGSEHRRLDAAVQDIAGSARSMGLQVVE